MLCRQTPAGSLSPPKSDLSDFGHSIVTNSGKPEFVSGRAGEGGCKREPRKLAGVALECCNRIVRMQQITRHKTQNVPAR
jgi:hypothetical protein